jgi:hypothetical protein
LAGQRTLKDIDKFRKIVKDREELRNMMNQSLGLKKMSINPAGVIGTKELLKGGIVEDATSQHSDRKEFYLNFEEMAAYHL